MGRPAWAAVELDAVAQNIATMVDLVRPAAVCAVVKADGYGHGAVPVARAALAAGASWLAVALPEEGAALRDAGIDDPVLVLSEPAREDFELVARFGLRPTLYTLAGVAAASAAGPAGMPVHIKVDTGMHRVGVDPGGALGIAVAVAERPRLQLEGLWTHCAAADTPASPVTAEQLRRFAAVRTELADGGIHPPIVHAANSAAAIAFPESRFDLVRIGIAAYGIAPSPELAGTVALRPALRLMARVSLVKRVAAGEGISYGHRHHFPAESVVATVPLGYADGVRRALGLAGGEVLIGGRRRRIVGVVTMDQLTVDCGQDDSVQVGDEVVLIGAQGDDRITAEELAERLDTIGYEIVCGIGPRVPRRYPRPC